MKRLLLLTAMLCVLAKPLAAQVSVALSPVPAQQFLSQTGAPLASGCVFTYISGTSTPLATYTDGTGTAQNTNPIILDAGGFGNIWLTNSSYRFSIFSAGGVNCASGVFQRTVDNVSAYSILNQSQNIFLAGASSDPGGSAGELAYRTDIPCFRGFSTLWDCFVTLTGVQALTNKIINTPTITSPVITGTVNNLLLGSPSINGLSMNNGPGTYIGITNAGITGTTINMLAKLTGAPSTAVISSAGDTGGAVGIVTSGAGIAGTAVIQQSGSVGCQFDGGVTSGDYVSISATTAGNCHDAGATYPIANQVLGRVLTTAGIAGLYTIDLFGPEIKPTNTAVVAVNTTGLTANVGVTGIVTPAVNGFYRFSCYLVITTAAGVSSTLPNCQVNWTDADSNIAESATANATSTVNGVGQVGPTQVSGINPISFYAKSGVAITYQTVNYASNAANAMAYALHLRLEGPF